MCRHPSQPPTALPPGPGSPRNAPQQANTAPQPGDEVVVEPPPQRITNPTAIFSGLDKITGRIISFDVAINETVQFGALQVTPRVCYSRPPTETPNTDAFVEVDEVTLQGEIKRIFTGWMFAASPGLHAVEHPIYDVWLTECKGGQNPNVAEVPADQHRQSRPPDSSNHSSDVHRPRHSRSARPAAGFLPATDALVTHRCEVSDCLFSADCPLERAERQNRHRHACLFEQPVIAVLRNFDRTERP